MIIDNSSEDAVTHSLVQLDCRNIIDTDKQVDEPAVVVIANALQRSGQLSSMTSPARRGTDRKTGYMGMPWEVIRESAVPEEGMCRIIWLDWAWVG